MRTGGSPLATRSQGYFRKTIGWPGERRKILRKERNGHLSLTDIEIGRAKPTRVNLSYVSRDVCKIEPVYAQSNPRGFSQLEWAQITESIT